ncbi:hypothetical protein NA56DRAFT_95824 [Hyaloscypha hepaticicola]|uniref:Uncharacterized protein n=1 Tax=Hyaloscypha hepaticicola TaxID=2082293 RepID=A0A2J6PD25_9HELO|nr:hypothetical protein NA56DRAFT_95824 [Hyaloscypha hepaticicola]
MLIFPLLAFVSLVLSQESVSITTSISLITITAAPSTTPTGAPPALIGYSTETDIGAYIPWYCDQGQIWSQDGNYARCCDSDPSVECPIGISCLNTSLIVGPNSQQTWSWYVVRFYSFSLYECGLIVNPQ